MTKEESEAYELGEKTFKDKYKKGKSVAAEKALAETNELCDKQGYRYEVLECKKGARNKRDSMENAE